MTYACGTCQVAAAPPFPVTARSVKIRSGEAGNTTTVRFMRPLAIAGSRHPLVRWTATQCIRGISHLDTGAMTAAINQYLATIPFVPDPYDDELLYEPQLVIRLHQQGEARVDCDDIATLGAALCRAIGLRTAFAVVAFGEPAAASSHIYVVAGDPETGDGWYALDATKRFQPVGMQVEPSRIRLVRV